MWSPVSYHSEIGPSMDNPKEVLSDYLEFHKA